MRMAVVLDMDTGLIVRFCVIPGNVLDSKTTRYVLEDVEETLDIRIEGQYHDAGYCTHELLQDSDSGVFNSLVVRMPSRSGFPYWDLYYRNKPMLNNSTKIFGGHVMRRSALCTPRRFVSSRARKWTGVPPRTGQPGCRCSRSGSLAFLSAP